MHAEFHHSLFVFRTLEIEQYLKYTLLFLLVLALVTLYFYDREQKEHSIWRNYPVIGHMRNFLEALGVYLRQYFYAMDREELPFDRATRSWIYRAAKNVENVVSFGSTRSLHPVGTIIFVDAPFPPIGE